MFEIRLIFSTCKFDKVIIPMRPHFLYGLILKFFSNIKYTRFFDWLTSMDFGRKKIPFSSFKILRVSLKDIIMEFEVNWLRIE